MIAESLSTLLFPLRTSVEMFRDPDSPAAHARAKQGALLYERLIFEEGLYDATLSSEGSTSMWKPANGVSAEELRQARTLHEEGAPFHIAIGTQIARGVPAPPEAMRVVMAGTVSRHYVAEWTSLLRELAPLEPDWVETFAVPGNALPRELKDQIRELDWEASRDRDLMPEADAFLRGFVHGCFNHDAVVAADLGAAFNITSQFASMLTAGTVRPDYSGGIALELWVPNVGELPWESVFEFRAHPGAQEARSRLRETEAMARASEEAAIEEVVVRVAQEVTKDLVAAIEDMKPKLGVEAVRQALHTGVSVIAPVAAPLAGLLETGRASRRYERSWRAALMRLRDRSG